MNNGLYKYFSNNQKLSLVLEAIEYRLSKMIPKDIRVKKIFLQRLFSLGISFQVQANNIIINYPLNGNKNFLIRDNSSDIQVFTQIILGQEYEPVIEVFKKLKLKINRFIDAGANAGFSSLYISSFFPEARFICLEPQGGNFAALSQNITRNIAADKYFLLQKALWNMPAQLAGDKSFRDGKDWSFAVKEDNSRGEIEGVTMNWLIQEFNFNEIDFLKIDIEGAEAQLFSNRKDVESWINNVKVISIEIHDETGLRFKIENMLQNLDFRVYHSGELTIAINKKIATALLND